MLRDEMKVTCIKETTPAPVALENIEYRIAIHMQGAYENMLEVGRCLNEAKEAGLVPHGQWETWVRKNTGMSERSAQKLMQAARSVLPGSAMAKLPISKIQAILALPEEAREPIAEKAVADDMSLRELQEAVKREKQRADQLAEINEKTAARAAANSRDAERAIREAQELRQKLQEADDRARSLENSRARAIKKLRDELDEAKQNAAGGISAEAQGEIDRLKAELADAESYAEQQAELRQQAQQELLNQKAQAARGETTETAFGAGDLAAAVRAFIGAAGVLPHIGADVARMGSGERAQMRQYVDMVGTWVDGARRALETVVICGEG